MLHPCDSGKHGCDKGPGGVCVKDSSLKTEWRCECKTGYTCTNGCSALDQHKGHTCKAGAAQRIPFAQVWASTSLSQNREVWSLSGLLWVAQGSPC